MIDLNDEKAYNISCLTEKILCLCSEECDGHEEKYIIEGKAGGIAAYREKLKKIVNPIKKQYFGRLYASGITDKEELTKLLGNRDVEIVIEKYE